MNIIKLNALDANVVNEILQAEDYRNKNIYILFGIRNECRTGALKCATLPYFGNEDTADLIATIYVALIRMSFPTIYAFNKSKYSRDV